MATIFLNEV